MSPLRKMFPNVGKVFSRMMPDLAKREAEKQQTPLVNNAPAGMNEKKEMLKEIIRFYDKKANEIMTPRTDIFAIDIKKTLEEVISAIVSTGYSRIPVYEEDEDHIKGVLYAKDLIPLLNHSTGDAWQSLIRKPFFVPESKKIYYLLNELRANKTHLAIVVDEFGCTSGLVTMEDILEEIVGDISDEYDHDEMSFLSLPDGSYIFEGKTQLNNFFRETGIPPSDFGELTEEAESLTGLMLAIKGTLPHKSEDIVYKKYRFRILEADERRIKKIKISFIAQLLALLCLSFSCANSYTPKPRGYLRIEPPAARYIRFQAGELPFSFAVSQQVIIELPPTDSAGRWMNIDYPALHAKIYCNYHPVTPQTLREHTNECIRLVERASERADAISEKSFENREDGVYGALYLIEGESSAPIQFMLTDSSSYFFRGALYYPFKPNADSIAPVTAYIEKDIAELMQTFHWER